MRGGSRGAPADGTGLDQDECFESGDWTCQGYAATGATGLTALGAGLR